MTKKYSLGIVGRKAGMSRLFTEDGKSVPVTLIEATPNRITQVKTVEIDGYTAVQVAVGYKRAALVNKPSAGHLAKAKVEGLSSSPGVDPFSYFIQAGAFRTPEDAEQQRAKLMLLGMQAKVTEREQAGRTVYRVRLGPFDKKEDADKAKERLDNNSIETALVRVQR